MTIESPDSSQPGMLRRILPGLVLSAVIILMMLWLTGRFVTKVPEKQAARHGRPAAGVRLMKVQLAAVPNVEAAVGTIAPVHESQLASKVLGRVTRIDVVAGQNVGKGQQLVWLDSAEVRARVEQATASRQAASAENEQAQRDLARGKTLFERNAMTKVEWERSQTRAATAAAQLARAQQAAAESESQLADFVVAAPYDGVVIDKIVNVGDIVRPGDVLLRLYDPTRMQLVGSVREVMAEKLEIGRPVEIQIPSLGEKCPAKITEIVPESETSTRTFLVKAVGACGPRVKKGVFGRLLIPLEQEGALMIPRAAVRHVGQLDVVDVAEGGELVRRIILLGRPSADGASVQVLSGLRVGEEIAASQSEVAGTDG